MTQDSRDLPILWKVSQVATYLGKHIVTVYKWIGDGRVFRADEIVRIGKNVRIKRSAVERLTREKQEELRNATP